MKGDGPAGGSVLERDHNPIFLTNTRCGCGTIKPDGACITPQHRPNYYIAPRVLWDDANLGLALGGQGCAPTQEQTYN
jgi:hypothetical protein